MEITILRTNTGNFGQIGSYNVQEVGLANALNKLGHKTSVIYLNKHVHNIEVDPIYSFVYYLPHKTFLMHGIFDVNYLNNFTPNVIIYFSDNQLWAKNVIYWCNKNNVKCVHYMGGVLSDNPHWLNQLYTKLILWRNKKAYNYSINVAKTEDAHKKMLNNNVPFCKTIPVGLDNSILNSSFNLDSKIRHELGFADDEVVLLFVGRLIDYKKPLFACDILNTMLSRGIKAKLVIIGDGRLKNELINYIQSSFLIQNVLFLERIAYNQMYKYMVSCNCFINLSDREIFGMAILEAMYYGLPVVAHVAPGPNTIIQHEETGYLCESYNIDEWYDLIYTAVNNREIGANSRRHVEANYMWDAIATRFIELVS